MIVVAAAAVVVEAVVDADNVWGWREWGNCGRRDRVSSDVASQQIAPHLADKLLVLRGGTSCRSGDGKAAL